jgi:hypothetical protein
MKKCPNCQQPFDDANDFWLNDGTRLIVTSALSSFDKPTQFESTPHSNQVAQSKTMSPLLYLLIGGLTTALGTARAFIYFNSTPKDEGLVNKTAGQRTPMPPVKALESTPPVTSTPQAAPVPVSGMSPGGNWSGSWTGKSSVFTAAVNLVEHEGEVSGGIVWTLQRSANPAKAGKAGLSATEYVQGRLDPSTRTVKMHGIRNDNPNSLIILDNYNLSLSYDGSTIGYHKKWHL